jgi:hypothetical protein
MRTSITLVLFAAVALTSAGATDCGSVIDDPGFDVWCGDRLCRWDLEKGDIAKAATWHQSDNGVEMIGADVAISQLTEVDYRDGHCIRFDLIADVAEDAEVHLLVDIFGDGTVELDQRIPTSDWRALSFHMRMPDFYQGVRFRLSKRGGHAVLANIGAEIAPAADCPGAALTVGARPDGVDCLQASDCASGVCAPSFLGSVCGDCQIDSDCTGTDVCGLVSIAPANLTLWNQCLAPASTALGLACARNEQCATGTCTDGFCSLCDSDADCSGGTCTREMYTVNHGGQTTIIAGGAHCVGGPSAALGAACLVDRDCASMHCGGAPLAMCVTSFFPRVCSNDMECPGYAFGSEPACVTVGTVGGTCQ